MEWDLHVALLANVPMRFGKVALLLHTDKIASINVKLYILDVAKVTELRELAARTVYQGQLFYFVMGKMWMKCCM